MFIHTCRSVVTLESWVLTDTVEMKDMIAEESKAVAKIEAKQLALSHEAAKIRADKEARYWALVQKLHKEKDGNSRLEKRIKAKSQQFDDTKAKCDKELNALQDQLKIKLFDLNQAEVDTRAAEDSIQKVKLSIQEHTDELAADALDRGLVLPKTPASRMTTANANVRSASRLSNVNSPTPGSTSTRDNGANESRLPQIKSR